MTLLLWLISFLCSSWHDIHVSKCELEYNAEENALQISTHIFVDDLETSISGKLINNLKLGTEYEIPGGDSMVLNYLAKHLQIKVNGVPQSMHLVGKELSDDYLALWIYTEIPQVGTIRRLDVQYDVLMELYDDQRNILSAKIPPGKKTFFLFDPKRRTETIVP